MHTHWPQVSARKRVSVCVQAEHPTKQIAGRKTGATEHYNYDPKANLRDGLTQAHAVFTCHTAARPFLQKLSPSHKASMLAAHTRNACSLSNPSNHTARGVPAQYAIARTPLWLTMMKVFPSGNGPRDPKQADGNISGQRSDYPANEGWQEDIQAWANCHHVLSPMGFKRKKKNPPNPPQQDSPVQCMPCEQTLLQPTPGPSGTQCLKDLFHEPSQHNEPPIPGLSPSSKPPGEDPTHEPEPEVAPTQSMEELFGKSQLHFYNSSQLFLTPPLPIYSLSSYSPLNHHH
ncbi:hypothetical protein O181_078285 [Austropuccinia psidii MF-1]|uniref:Uncharacterized protein n=1 Tax=Austropuccinia psidii MF-1 TaxID=1389203 RepID=A0A9Q3IGT7_9BASI|nr:hypothetical protein [Austropuccinia psidii MF-1]